MNANNDRRGVYTLKIADKDINLLFSMNFWRILSQEKIYMETLGETLDGSRGMVSMLDSLSKMVIAGGKSYAAKHKTKFEYTIDEVFEWFSEDIDDTVMAEMIKVMMDTKVFGKTMNQGQNRTPGKKKPKK